MAASRKIQGVAATSKHSAPTQATPPFDRGDADLILRTSDLVDFHVHRQILVIASPFFECRLCMSQPPTYPVDQPPAKPQVIDVSEDSRTMEIFLRLIYPTLDADIVELSLLRNVLDAAVKYESSVVLAAMKRAMVSPCFLHAQPLAIFVIACRHRLEDEAKAAAQQLVKLDSSLQNHDDPSSTNSPPDSITDFSGSSASSLLPSFPTTSVTHSRSQSHPIRQLL